MNYRKLLILPVILLAIFGGVAGTTTARANDNTNKTLPPTHDWYVSAKLADRVFPGTFWWLWDCSSSEGAHGSFIWIGSYPLGSPGTENYYSYNRPGGWMQFEHTTFDSNKNAALAELHQKGFKVDHELINYFEPLGQALVAGYMRYHGMDRGQWTGWKC